MARADKKNPDKLIQRHLILEYIRSKHEPQELEDMVPGTKFVEELFDTEGEPALFFDWEFMLFEAPLPELDHMAQKLYNKVEFAKKKDELVNGIVSAQVQNEVDKRRHQGMTMTNDEIMELKIKANETENNPIMGLVDKFGEALKTAPQGDVTLRIVKDEDGKEEMHSMKSEGITINQPTKVLTINIPENLTDGEVKDIMSTVMTDVFPEEMNRIIAYFISMKDLEKRRAAFVDYILSVKDIQIANDSRDRQAD